MKNRTMGDRRAMFKCSECDKSFASKRYLKKHCARGHALRNGDDGELACSMCSKTFAYLSHLRRHQMSHLNVREHECAHCDAKFVQKTHLLAHIARKHTVQPIDQNCQSAYSLSAYTSSTRSDAIGELRKVQCTECGASLESRWHLTRHHNRKHKSCTCLVCGKEFPSVGALHEHSDQHDATRTHQCSVCKRRFRRSNQLKLHEQSHSGEGRLLCVCCNAIFIQRTQLDRHIARSHNVRRSCAACAEHFSAITQYCSHMRIIHAEATCAYCGCEDTSKAHREAKHWRRLAKPRPLAVLAQQTHTDQEPMLKLIVLLDDQNVNSGGLIEVHKGFPPGLVEAFPGLAHLQIRVTDFMVNESMKSIVLSFPVDAEAKDDPQVAQFIQTPIYIDFRN